MLGFCSPGIAPFALWDDRLRLFRDSSTFLTCLTVRRTTRASFPIDLTRRVPSHSAASSSEARFGGKFLPARAERSRFGCSRHLAWSRIHCRSCEMIASPAHQFVVGSAVGYSELTVERPSQHCVLSGNVRVDGHSTATAKNAVSASCRSEPRHRS